MPDKTDLRRGLALRKKLNGKRFGKITGNVARLAPDLEQIINEVMFGRVWARKGLDLRTRCLVAVGMLAVLQRPKQIEAYVANALEVGVKQSEIVEVLIQSAFYGGMAAAVNSIDIAAGVFAQK